MDDHYFSSRRHTLRIRCRSGIRSLVDTVGIALNGVALHGLIALCRSVRFGLARVLVLREARKCCTEDKGCENELGGFGLKPHGCFLLRQSCGKSKKATMHRR